jgi:hypothetical protein
LGVCEEKQDPSIIVPAQDSDILADAFFPAAFGLGLSDASN